MKLKIIGKKADNIIPVLKRREEERECLKREKQRKVCHKECRIESSDEDDDDDEGSDDSDSDGCKHMRRGGKYDKIKNIKHKNLVNDCDSDSDRDDSDDDRCKNKCMSSPPEKDNSNNKKDMNIGLDSAPEKKEIIKNEEKLDENDKESIMKMVRTQNFVEGFWEENEYTKEIMNKYKKEYEQIKEIKNKNMNDTIALTILIIYFLNKEHPNLISELIMIIKKAKQFISKQTKDNYDNIIKEIGLN